ncbi:MAG: hypothetical protein KDA81_04650 [Planctomycetaceae bacterium]|nr:hypothetical protein [Planctomycetaceae bacterium]
MPITDVPSAANLDDSRRLVVIQRNPRSGSGHGAKELITLVRCLRQRGFRVRMFADRRRMDSFLASDETWRQIRCIVAAGGDGTVGDVLNRQPHHPIAVLPLGTENLLARYLQIHRDGTSVALMIERGLIKEFDTGIVTACRSPAGESNSSVPVPHWDHGDSHRFLLMASAGIDSAVVNLLHQNRTGHITHFSYVQPVLKALFGTQLSKLTVLDEAGRPLASGSHVIFTNIPEYGFRLKFAPDADPGDGMLNLTVFHKGSRWESMKHMLRLRWGQQHPTGTVSHFHGQHFYLTAANSETRLQCDGDPSLRCPVRVSVAAGSIKLLVPENRSPQ